MLGTLGTPEMIFIFLLALLLFGPKKLPEIGRTVGKALTEFRRASNELKATFDREMKNLEAESGMKEVVSQYNYEAYNSYNYDYSSQSTYEPAYESQSYDSAASTATIASASATEGAESPVAVAPEGTIAHHPEIAERTETAQAVSENPAPSEGHLEGNSASTTAEHKA